jgi:FAD synthetase
MKGILSKSIDRPVVAVVGAWDPLISEHEHLFRQLSTYARQISLASVVIMLHPPPPSFIPDDPMEWPIYDDPEARIARIETCGIDTTLMISFVEQDLDATAEEFFRTINAYVKLNELFLGDKQSLGRCREASNEVVAQVAKRRGTHLERLPPFSQHRMIWKARDLLRQGLLAESIRIVGRAPVWHRPANKTLRLAWPPGRYLGLPIESPTALPQGKPILMQLVLETDGFSVTAWPDDQVEWLAFTAGPSDLIPNTTSEPARVEHCSPPIIEA